MFTINKMPTSLPKSEVDAGLANPQMPLSTPESPEPRKKEMAKIKELEFLGLKTGMPSWDDLRGTPHFKIGIVIYSTTTNDRHISAIAKPATPCSLSTVVVLNSEEGENRDQSMKKWFHSNRMQSDASKISVRWGQQGLKELFESDVDAVYIIVPPG
jgi:hypothetical protein